MELIKNVTDFLENIAPLQYQENYDNAGLITGNQQMQVKGITVTLDCTEAVIDEAIANNCNMIVAHHPIVFSGLKKINGKNYVERAIIKAIKNDVAIYAIHTNLDNVSIGVNAIICEKLGLKNTSVLSPKADTLRKLITFVPTDQADALRQALFNAGGGSIGNYDECSFNVSGTGTFRAGSLATPFVGEQGKQHHESEVRIEMIYESFRERQILSALTDNHPYEEVAYDIYHLENKYSKAGSGMIGESEVEMTEQEFLIFLKETMQTACIRHTALLNRKVNRVAVCGGAGSFLLKEAIAQKASVFVTSDFKYHQFFDADSNILIADIGHYESEQYTSELLAGLLKRNFSTFAVRLTKINTNPVNYF